MVGSFLFGKLVKYEKTVAKRLNNTFENVGLVFYKL